MVVLGEPITLIKVFSQPISGTWEVSLVDYQLSTSRLGGVEPGDREVWERGFSKLLQFKELEGHCNVSFRFELDGFKLGRWVGKQRAHKDRIALALKRRLDDIGFVWDPIADQWEEGFSKLLQFKELEGHCKVPARFKLDGYKLGTWVSGRRRNKDNISPDRKQRLDDLGFIWDLKESKPNDQ
jgi:hypothetical protein